MCCAENSTEGCAVHEKAPLGIKLITQTDLDDGNDGNGEDEAGADEVRDADVPNENEVRHPHFQRVERDVEDDGPVRQQGAAHDEPEEGHLER